MAVFIFFFIIILLLLPSLNNKGNTLVYIHKGHLRYSIVLGIIVFVLYIISLSKQNLFQSDTIAYFYNLQSIHSLIQSNSVLDIFNQVEFEKGFILLQIALGAITGNAQTYSLIMYSIIILLPIIATGYYFGLESMPFIMLQYMFFNVFNTISLIVLRQGIAIGILLISLMTYLKGHKKVSILLMIISAQFHSTAYIMFVSLLVIEFFKINLKWLLTIWGIGSLLYVTGWNQRVVQYLPFDSKYISNYTGSLWSGQSELYGQVPNAIKYLLFSAAFLIVILFFKKMFLNNDIGMIFLSKIYVVWNTIFLIFGFVAFSSRIALYSWMLFPLIIFYAFWSNKVLKGYYPVLLVVWLISGLISLPIFGWKAI